MTLAEIWKRYAEAIPAEATETQHVETERAFYRGAAAALQILLDAGNAPDRRAEIKKLQRELAGKVRDIREAI